MSLIKKHIGIFRQIAPDTPPEKVARLQEEVELNAKLLEDYWRRFARHVWDVQVRGYVMVGVESTTPPVYAQNDIAKYIAEHDMEGFEPNYFHVHGGFNTAACGHGNLPGNRSSTYLSYGGCGIKTIIHELGHNFGLWHASTRKPDGSWSMYGDGTSIMGSSPIIRGLNGPNLINLKLEDEREILEIEETQQILLAPVELAKHELHENEYQHARIKKNRVGYHLSIRKLKERGGFYYNTEEPEILYVHEAPLREKSMRQLPDMYPGDTQVLTDGTKIEYLEYSDECARVNVYYNKNDERPEDIPMPTGFPATVAVIDPSEKHNGLWYNKDFVGEGFDVHIDDGQVTVYWYTYNQFDDSRRFYVGSCPLTGGPLEFDLYTTTGGTWEDPTTRDTINVGRAQLYFIDDGNAVFNFHTTEHGRGSVEVIPAALSQHPSNGVYYDPARDGEGFSVQFFEELSLCILYFYSYGPRQRGKEIGDQRWYWCKGTKVSPDTYEIEIYEAEDNTWMGFRNDPNVEKVGRGTMKVLPSGLALEYNIDSGTVAGSGISNLRRV